MLCGCQRCVDRFPSLVRSSSELSFPIQEEICWTNRPVPRSSDARASCCHLPHRIGVHGMLIIVGALVEHENGDRFLPELFRQERKFVGSILAMVSDKDQARHLLLLLLREREFQKSCNLSAAKFAGEPSHRIA